MIKEYNMIGNGYEKLVQYNMTFPELSIEAKKRFVANFDAMKNLTEKQKKSREKHLVDIDAYESWLKQKKL